MFSSVLLRKNYCRLFYVLKRISYFHNMSKLKKLITLSLVLLIFTFSICSGARGAAPDVKRIVITYKDMTGNGYLVYKENGNLTQEICLFDSRDPYYANRLEGPKGTGLLQFFKNSSGFFVEFNDLIEFAGYTDPFPINSTVSFSLKIKILQGTSVLSVTIGEHKLNVSLSAQDKPDEKVINLTFFEPKSASEYFFELKRFIIVLKSISEKTRIFLEQARVFAHTYTPLVPIRFSYYDVSGIRIVANTSTVRNNTLYLLGTFGLYLHLDYRLDKRKSSIYVIYPADIIYVDPNGIINNISIGIDAWAYPPVLAISQQITVPSERGLIIDAYIPFSKIDLSVVYLNHYPAEIEWLDAEYYDEISVLGYVAREIMTRYDEKILLLLPGKYRIYLHTPTSLGGSLSCTFTVNVGNKNMAISIVFNAFYINGLVLRIEEFLPILVSILLGCFLLVAPLAFSDTREMYLQVLRRPLFYAIIFLLVSSFLPSIGATYFNKYISQTEEIMIVDLFTIILSKKTGSIVYKIEFYYVTSLYGIFLAIFWLFYPLVVMFREILKPTLELNVARLKRTLTLSLVAKIIFLSTLVTLLYTNPYGKILASYPGLGIFLYGLSIIPVLLELRRSQKIRKITSYLKRNKSSIM
ncbi:MAG: hypothetical protein ACTSX9_01495 [Candidatus Njordarchaeales archaeon]